MGFPLILAVDPGYAKCGWAIVDATTGRVRDLGLILTAKDPKVSIPTDRARRLVAVSKRLAALATEHDVTAIAAEEPLGFGASAAVAANQLPWGALVMLAVSRGYSLHGVGAKVWQRAVLGVETKKVDYAQVEAALSGYVDAQASESLRDVPEHLRNHALDAVGVGLLVAMREHEAARIIARKEQRRPEPTRPP